jgi:hypothetical protein
VQGTGRSTHNTRQGCTGSTVSLCDRLHHPCSTSCFLPPMVAAAAHGDATPPHRREGDEGRGGAASGMGRRPPRPSFSPPAPPPLLAWCASPCCWCAALWGALHPTPHPADSTPPSETRNQRQHFRGTTVPGIFGGGESNGDHGEPQFALSADPVQQGEAFYSIFAFHSDLHHSPHHRRVQPTIR